MIWFKFHVKRFFHFIGLDIRKSPKMGFFTPYTFFNCTVVFDVGANTGQFARILRRGGYKGHIYSFEPLSSAHEKLCLQSSKDSNWEVHPRVAIGNAEFETNIHIARNSVSSSLLDVTIASTESAAKSDFESHESVQVLPLSIILQETLTLEKFEGPRGLKVDTQGFEMQVLEGLNQYLTQFHVIQLELSLVELYIDQSLASEISAYMLSKGYVLWSIEPGFSNPKTGRLLQYDAFFVLKELAHNA